MPLAEAMPGILAQAADLFQREGSFVLRLFLAALCGAVVGWQREKQEKAAGLRTHILLTMGACLFTLVALRIKPDEIARLIQGMVTGAGFLAGGVIFREGATVRGLTTATGLWVMAAVGLAAGIGDYFLAGLTTVLMFIVLSVLRRVEDAARRRRAAKGEKP